MMGAKGSLKHILRSQSNAQILYDPVSQPLGRQRWAFST